MADDETKSGDDPAGDKPENVANSATKTPEQKTAQANPVTAPQAPVELDHGEPSEETEAEVKATEALRNDPWGNTPAQMRDQHDPLVDPELVDPISTGLVADQLRGTTRLDPMEPQSDEALAEAHGVSGGTNAPA